jgi:hypothetical protein
MIFDIWEHHYRTELQRLYSVYQTTTTTAVHSYRDFCLFLFRARKDDALR